MNGYTTIAINGQSVGIKFNYKAVGDFFIAAVDKRDSYYVGEDKFTYLGIAKLLKCGYDENCVIKEQEPAYSLEFFFNWVEGAYLNNSEKDKAEITKALETFNQSQYVKTLVEQMSEPKEEGSKKKTSKPTLKRSKAKS
jgi:hypothetical protein